MKYDFILSAVIGKKTTPALLEIILYETQRSSVKESWEQAMIHYIILFNSYNDYNDKNFENKLLLREKQRK